MIHIALADDQLLFRKGIIALINTFKGIKVVIEAESGTNLISLLENPCDRVDVVLLDINMPGLNGIKTLEIIKVKFPELKNIILTVHEEEKYIVTLIDSGANAYLPKNAEPNEVEEAIRTVMTNDFYFNANSILAMKNKYKYVKSNKIKLDATDVLTKREKEILLLLCQELTAAEIAQKLFLSTRTIEGHRNNMLLKTGSRNTAGLIIFAIKNDLFDLGN